MVERGDAVPLCPEQMGGLPTPRIPAEKMGERVLTKEGRDVTHEYTQGALEAFKMVKMLNAKEAYLKSKSPMCGHGKIYDGSFSGKLTSGDGVFTEILKKSNITVHSVD